jgi:hypothetical protein
MIWLPSLAERKMDALRPKYGQADWQPVNEMPAGMMNDL